MSRIPPSMLSFIAAELGDVRAELKRLKARESQLRQCLIDARPNAPIEGGSIEVTIRRSTRRKFLRDKLPSYILQDPQYWQIAETNTVVTKKRRISSPEDDRELAVIEPYRD